MKILVTGAAGFIGSHLCEELIKDHEVTGVDNLSLGTLENINHLDFRFYQQDVLNLPYSLFKNGFDAVFHLAANSDISSGDPEKDLHDTFATTYELLEKCRKFNIKQFIFTSSGSVYGEAKKQVDESYCGLPISHYAAAKISSEAFISAYAHMYGMKAWILRFPNVIGERMTHGVILDFINKLKINPRLLTVLGNGLQSKPYMYVKELIDAMLFVWKNTNETVNLFNISGKGNTPVFRIAEMVVEEMGLSAEIVYGGTDRGWPGDVPLYLADISRLKDLGWEPKLTSDEAVRVSIQKML